MAELEDLLLEAAGRTNVSGRNQNSRPPPRRQSQGSYPGDGSDSGDDESDEESSYVSSRQQPGSLVSSRKRLDHPGKDDDEHSGEDDDYQGENSQGGSSDESDVGSDLYKNEYDREKLAQMSELDREMILSERAQKRDDQRLTERVRAKQSRKKIQSVKQTQAPPSSHLRSSVRSAERVAAKDGALKELRARRLKRQDPEGDHQSRDTARGNSVGKGFSSIRSKSITAPSESDSQSRSDDKDEESVGDGELDDISTDKTMNNEVMTYEDIKDITVRRSKLAKWFMEPFFEELIVGCFVRVGIGRIHNRSCYRLCIIKNVDAATSNRHYELDNKRTNKRLNLAWGSAEKKWEMTLMSDSPPTESEFDEWVQQMKKDAIRLPNQQDIREKREAIQKVNTYVYSPETVKQMLQEKKSALSRPLNVAAEKDRLRRELKIAEGQQNEAEVERIQARLQELEAISKQVKQKDDKRFKLHEMNKRNRADNFKNASALKPVNTGLKAGEAGYDPFSRRWTRSRNYYVPSSLGVDATVASMNDDDNAKSSGRGVSNDIGAKGTEDSGMATTTAALEAAAGAGKLVDTSAPVDHGTTSNSLHNFEIIISLTKLVTAKGSQRSEEHQKEMLARKHKVEATIGYKVLEDDENSHPHALSINDYKRRRGLL